MQHVPPYRVYVLVDDTYHFMGVIKDRVHAMQIAVATTKAGVDEVMFTDIVGDPVAHVWPGENRYELV